MTPITPESLRAAGFQMAKELINRLGEADKAAEDKALDVLGEANRFVRRE